MLREECGVFGIYGHPQAAEVTYLGLHALQQRGEESSGIEGGGGGRLHRAGHDPQAPRDDAARGRSNRSPRRVSAPPIISPCYYGIDFQTRDELIASRNTVEQIRAYLGVDSLGYLSVEGMLQAVPNDRFEYCTACFTAQYPIPIEGEVGKAALEHQGV